MGLIVRVRALLAHALPGQADSITSQQSCPEVIAETMNAATMKDE
jgi:hypothetical protein